MNLCNITETLHGELPHIGAPCKLIRLSGCNLKCKYCDTDFSFKFKRSVNEISKIIQDSHIRSILITGGEPLLQHSEILDLIKNFDRRYNFILETNGSLPIPDWDFGTRITTVMDVKLEEGEGLFDILNLQRIRPLDVIKFVFWNEESFEKGRDFFLAHQSDTAWNINWVFSPTMEVVMRHKMEDYSKSIIELQRTYSHQQIYLQIQLHKILKIS